jgi:hypothetical protein
MPTDDKKQSNVSDAPPVIFAEDAIPPMLSNDNVQHPTQSPVANVSGDTKQDINTPTPVVVSDTGSAAPADDVVMPPVITTINPPKKKFAGGKVIATILGLFILVGGVGTGVYLTQQNQNINEKAGDTNPLGPTTVSDISQVPADALAVGCTGAICGNGTTGEYRIENHNDRTDAYVPGNCPTGTYPDLTQAPTCSVAPPNCCSNAPDGHVVYSWGQDRQDFWECVYPCKPVLKLSCQSVTAYAKGSETVLTSSQLSELKTGDVIKLCVTGSATGSNPVKYDKAKFTINSVEQTEISVATADNKFCQEYTIPTGTTTFNITAKMHYPNGDTWVYRI